MSDELISRSLLSFPAFHSFLDEDNLLLNQSLNGLSISEDDKYVYVEAALPGIDPKDVEITFDKGILWIKGEAAEEEKNKKKKFYRRAVRSFSYRVAVPGELDMTKEPVAESKHGILTVAFAKKEAAQPKKITIKSA